MHICLEKISKNIPKMECGHHFHINCIRKWSDTTDWKVTCPLCRKLITIYPNTRSQKNNSKHISIVRNLLIIQQKSLYEKRILLHSIKPEAHLYDERFRIPLIFHGSSIKSNRIIEKQVKMVDVFPTILELVGIKIDENKIHGKSLAQYVKGNDMIEEPALIDSLGNWTITNTSNCIGIRTSKYKYFRDKDNPEKKIHLFDLLNDPLEENNIANDNESLILNFEKIMSDIINKDFTSEKYIIKQKISKKYKKLHLKKYHE